METNTGAILARLDLIERETQDIRRMLVEEPGPPAELKGMLKGMRVDEGDIEEAKRSWERRLDDL